MVQKNTHLDKIIVKKYIHLDCPLGKTIVKKYIHLDWLAIQANTQLGWTIVHHSWDIIIPKYTHLCIMVRKDTCAEEPSFTSKKQCGYVVPAFVRIVIVSCA
jgi:hypothetical protein